MPYGCCHLADLTIPALMDRNFYPCSRYGLAEADGNGTWRYVGGTIKKTNFRRPGFFPLDQDTGAQCLQRLSRWNPLNLGKICARVSEIRREQKMNEPLVIGQKQKTLAVCVQPPDGVDIPGKRPEFPKCAQISF